MIELPGNEDHPYTYDDPIIVNCNTEKGQLCDEMRNIYELVREIAMDDLLEPAFIEFYNPEGWTFLKADLTKVRDRASGTVAGFLLAVFYIKKSNGRVDTLGKAFHAFKRKYRGTYGEYDRKYLYGKYMSYFWETYVQSSGSKTYERIFESIGKYFKGNKMNWKHIVESLYSDIQSAGNMRIEILAENPKTYSDLFRFGLNIDTVKPTERQKRMLALWSPNKLMMKSMQRWSSYATKRTKKSEYINDTKFYVNTSASEWRGFFSSTDVYRKFYLWQNFGCPNSAINVNIPVDVENILNVCINLAVAKLRQNRTAIFFERFATSFWQNIQHLIGNSNDSKNIEAGGADKISGFDLLERELREAVKNELDDLNKTIQGKNK
jgi:hypothetical protein